MRKKRFGCLVDLSFELAIQDIWEPYKEPCKHEPNNLMGIHRKQKTGFFTDQNVLTFTPQDFEMAFRCKHCGVKIRAEKWVEA